MCIIINIEKRKKKIITMGKLTGKELYFLTFTNSIFTPQKPTSQTYFEQTLKPILFACYICFTAFQCFAPSIR